MCGKLIVYSLVFIPILTLYNEILLAVFGICIQLSLKNQALLSKKTQVAVNPFHQESVDEQFCPPPKGLL